MAQLLRQLEVASLEMVEHVRWLGAFGEEPGRGSLNHARVVEQMAESLGRLHQRWESELETQLTAASAEHDQLCEARKSLEEAQESLRTGQQELKIGREELAAGQEKLTQGERNLEFDKSEAHEWEKVLRGQVECLSDEKVTTDVDTRTLHDLVKELQTSSGEAFEQLVSSTAETLGKFAISSEEVLDAVKSAATDWEKLQASLETEQELRQEISGLRLELDSRPGEGALDTAMGRVSHCESELREARLALARANDETLAMQRACAVQYGRAEKFLADRNEATSAASEWMEYADLLEEELQRKIDALAEMVVERDSLEDGDGSEPNEASSVEARSKGIPATPSRRPRTTGGLDPTPAMTPKTGNVRPRPDTTPTSTSRLPKRLKSDQSGQSMHWNKVWGDFSMMAHLLRPMSSCNVSEAETRQIFHEISTATLAAQSSSKTRTYLTHFANNAEDDFWYCFALVWGVGHECLDARVSEGDTCEKHGDGRCWRVRRTAGGQSGGTVGRVQWHRAGN